jgi:hypothetical protein
MCVVHALSEPAAVLPRHEHVQVVLLFCAMLLVSYVRGGQRFRIGYRQRRWVFQGQWLCPDNANRPGHILWCWVY